MNKHRISGIISLLTVTAVATLATMCANPLLNASGETGLSTPGTLEITMAVVGTDRAAVPVDYPGAASSFEVVLSGTQGLGPVAVDEPNLVLDDLPLGEYMVTVTARGADGRTLAAGSSPAVVTDSGDDEVSVDLLPVMGGRGSVSIELDWTAAGLDPGYIDGVVAAITPTGGSGIPLRPSLTESGLVFSDDYSSGEYVLSIDLSAGGTRVCVVTLTVLVVDGMETSVLESLGTEAFGTPPAAPRDLTAVQQRLSVVLSWSDSSDREAGYEVYRSEDGGDFRILGSGISANETSWTDEPVVPGTEYVYRVAAVNPFGTSFSRDAAVTVTSLIITSGEVRSNTEAVLGRSDNYIPVSVLLDGYARAYGDGDLEIGSLSLEGGGSVELREGYFVIDTASLPDSAVGGNLVLRFSVHIPGTPHNDVYSVDGYLSVTLVPDRREEAPETVTAFVYDEEEAFENAKRTYRPPNPESVYDGWGRISNHGYFENGVDAEASVEEKDDEADLARWWKLKRERGVPMVEYAKNSVYAGLVVPEGQEDDDFVLEATVVSKDDDDDTAGLIVAFVRSGGENYVLEAGRSHGSTSGGRYVEPRTGWGLVVRRLHSDAENPAIGEVLWSRQIDAGGIDGRGWRSAATRIRVERNGSLVRVAASDWDEPDSFLAGSEIIVDLSRIPELARFRGPRPYGFFTASQERTGFYDIAIEGGAVLDKIFFLDPESGESEVWWYEATTERWIYIANTEIREVLGVPVEAVNPATGRRYLIE